MYLSQECEHLYGQPVKLPQAYGVCFNVFDKLHSSYYNYFLVYISRHKSEGDEVGNIRVVRVVRNGGMSYSEAQKCLMC